MDPFESFYLVLAVNFYLLQIECLLSVLAEDFHLVFVDRTKGQKLMQIEDKDRRKEWLARFSWPRPFLMD